MVLEALSIQRVREFEAAATLEVDEMFVVLGGWIAKDDYREEWVRRYF